MDKSLDFDKLEAYLQSQSDATKIYIGGDSERIRSQGLYFADYATVVVVHIDGCRGCKIFGKVERERVFDQRKDRPTMRLMTEVQKISEMYLRIAPMIERFELLGNVQIHLDLNAKKIHASNLVVSEAVGYIRGVTGHEPQIKPDAWSASYAADRYKEILSFYGNPPSAENIRKHSGANKKKKPKVSV